MSPLKKLGFLWSYSLLAVIVGGYYLGATWAAVPYVFVVIPLLDALFGKDAANVGKEAYEAVLHDRYFDGLVYSFVYLQYGLLVWGAYVLTVEPLTWIQRLGLIFSIGLFSGTIINVAHELGHRSSRIAQVHARAALVSVSYLHWLTEHNRGHHVHVATPLDPATARRNQSLYAFWGQSLVGGFRSAWAIEERLLRKDPSRRDERTFWLLLPLLLMSVLTIGFSLWQGTFAWPIPIFFLLQSLTGILLLESVNYIEHYGIERRRLPGESVRYERVNPLHSWNASHLISNLVLFQLQRHSDHHAYAARPYQVLRHFDESPQLPFGYPLMILLALVPPLCFRLMNPRLDTWKARACSAEEIQQVIRQYA